MMRKTISVRHQKLDEYAWRLDSPQRDRLMHAIDSGALMAVFRINALTVTLENIGWPTGVDGASRVEVEPELVTA